MKDTLTPNNHNNLVSALQGKDPMNLTWDGYIYPRANRSQQTVSAYVEALDIGDSFPPIRVQRVFNYTDEQGNGTPEEIVTIIIGRTDVSSVP